MAGRGASSTGAEDLDLKNPNVRGSAMLTLAQLLPSGQEEAPDALSGK